MLNIIIDIACDFWHFGQWPSLMPKYGNFDNRHVSRKMLLLVSKSEKHKLDSWGRNGVYVQLLELWQMESWFSSRASRPMSLLFSVEVKCEISIVTRAVHVAVPNGWKLNCYTYKNRRRLIGIIVCYMYLYLEKLYWSCFAVYHSILRRQNTWWLSIILL